MIDCEGNDYFGKRISKTDAYEATGKLFIKKEMLLFFEIFKQRRHFYDRKKKVIIHDLPQKEANNLFSCLGDDYIVIDANIKAVKCIGCFKCWLKTPGICGFADKLEKVGQMVLASEKLIIITEMLYGGVSIPVKRVLDRSIPGVTPFFKKKNGYLHHLQRYKSETEIKAVFYNSENLTHSEKVQGKEYIEAMGLNFYSKCNEVLFIERSDFDEVIL